MQRICASSLDWFPQYVHSSLLQIYCALQLTLLFGRQAIFADFYTEIVRRRKIARLCRKNFHKAFRRKVVRQNTRRFWAF